MNEELHTQSYGKNSSDAPAGEAKSSSGEYTAGEIKRSSVLLRASLFLPLSLSPSRDLSADNPVTAGACQQQTHTPVLFSPGDAHVTSTCKEAPTAESTRRGDFGVKIAAPTKALAHFPLLTNKKLQKSAHIPPFLPLLPHVFTFTFFSLCAFFFYLFTSQGQRRLGKSLRGCDNRRRARASENHCLRPACSLARLFSLCRRVKQCRVYRTASDIWQPVAKSAKNVTEIDTPARYRGRRRPRLVVKSERDTRSSCETNAINRK